MKIIEKIHPELSNFILTPISVANLENQNSVHCVAMWDTGCNCVAISEELVKKLNLKPTNSGEAAGIKEKVKQDFYTVTLVLANQFVGEDTTLFNVEVGTFKKVHPLYDVILGMNVISKGSLALDFDNGMPKFGFKFK